jgi:hypothetical protein
LSKVFKYVEIDLIFQNNKTLIFYNKTASK